MPQRIDVPGMGVVEFPDGMSDDQIAAAIKQNMPQGDTFAQRFDAAPKPPQESTLSDVAKSAGGGLASGVAGLIGLPNTLGNLVDMGVRGAHKLVTGNELPKSEAPVSALSPEAGTIIGGIEKVTGKLHEPQSRTGKYARTIGEFLPGALMGGGGLLGRIGGNVLAPAIGSETAGQLTEGTKGEGVARLAGALGGALAPSALSRAVTPLPTATARQSAVDTLRKEGVDVTAGQSTGRKGLQYFESEMGGRKAADLMERQGEQFTAAALKRAGVNANRATPDVVDDAFKQIGQQFDDLAARNWLEYDKPLSQNLLRVQREYSSLVPESQRAPIVAELLDDVHRSAQRGVMTGEAYSTLRSRVDRLARSTKADPQLNDALTGIRNALDDAAERTIAVRNPSDLGAWRDVRRQYRNMLVLEKAATGAGENAAQGLISPSALRNAVVNQGRRSYARGKGDFADLARAGEAVLKPLPQSGTAPRLRAQGLMQGVGAAGGASAGGQQGGVEGALLGALLGAAVPFAAGRVGLSKPVQGYLKNQKLAKPRALLQQLERQGILGSRYLEDDR